MRITSISARNFLSFGSDGFTLSALIPSNVGSQAAENVDSECLDGLEDAKPAFVPPTFLVGPNGAGKTNVLRVVQTLLAACTVRGQDDPTVRERYHRPDGQTQPIRLTMGVKFDQSEFQAITQWWKLALAYGEQLGGLAEIVVAGAEKPRNNQALPKQRERYAVWLLQHVADAGLNPLSQGELILEVRDPATTSSYERATSLQLRFANGLILDLFDSTIRGELGGDGNSGQILGRRMAQQLPMDQLHDLAEFLDHEQDGPLTINPDFLTRMPADLPKTTARLTRDEIAASTMPEVLAAWTSLKQHFPIQSNDNYNLGQLVACLITNAVVCIERWDADTACTLEGLVSPVTTQLTSGHLGGYLARLKNGSAEDRARYETIRAQYQALTGTAIDVQITPVAGTAHTDMTPRRWIVSADANPANWTIEPDYTATVRVNVVTEDDLPLNTVGAGKTQFLFWVVLMNVHANKVVIFDEPDSHLHPRLADKLAQTLMLSEAQFLVVSHSPYMLPPGHLDLVRRVALRDGASWVTPPMTPKDAKALAIRKRGLEPDDRLFLYANAVVFVEGPNDAMVLREWVDRWAGHELLHTEGIDIRECEGKRQVAPFMGIADHFGIPCLGVWDFDVLLSKAPGKKTSADNNRDVLTQWAQYGLVDPAIVPDLDLDNKKVWKKFPSRRVFLVGDNEARANMEALFKKAFGTNWAQSLNDEGYYGPVTYREWARRTPPPPWFEELLSPLFEAIRSLPGLLSGAKQKPKAAIPLCTYQNPSA